jgi:hypothetical protein
MSRNLTRILMAVLVLNAFAVGAAMLWPNTAHSTANKAVVAAIDFDYVFNSVSTAPRPVSTPAAAATVDFDKVFASIAGSHRMNTPPNRERLRNIGWRRILGS